MSEGSISKKKKNPTPEKGIRKNEKEEEEEESSLKVNLHSRKPSHFLESKF
jgi:hypothetical protein